MASVWYVALADRRVIRSADWDAAGTNDTGDYAWQPSNGYSYPTTAFTTDQLAYLDSLNSEFWVGAPDGPRTVVVPDPVGYVTEVRVRELISQASITGLTPASVGLGDVNNTSDAAKPVSVAQAAALASKADYPGGGTDGQVLAKDGSTTRWVTPAEAGGNSGTLAVVQVADPDMPSGYSYRMTGSGVAPVDDPDLPSGTGYRIT